MPLLNGVEAARQLQVAVPASKLIFVTVHSDSPYVVEAFRAGACGYVLKRSAASELVADIHEVLNGNLYVTPLIAKSALEGILKVAEKRGPLLSTRQREVLQLVAEGHSAKEIADILRISPKTVEFHKGWFMKKLDCTPPPNSPATRWNTASRITERLNQGIGSRKRLPPIEWGRRFRLPTNSSRYPAASCAFPIARNAAPPPPPRCLFDQDGS